MPGRSAILMSIDPKSEWDVTQYLLAEIIDREELGNWLFIEANSEQNDIPIPEPYWRPGSDQEEPKQAPESEKPKRKFASPQEVAALFSGQF